MTSTLIRFAGAFAGLIVLSPAMPALSQLAPGVPGSVPAAPAFALTSSGGGPFVNAFRVDAGSLDSSSAGSSLPADTLPEAPMPAVTPLRASVPDSFSADGSQATPNVAPRLTKYIPSGWTAQRINGRDKFLLGVRDLYSPLNFVAMIASAGYEHALNSEPNYGTDKGAFGQRLGAAAIRESTQGFFTDSIFAPIYHEDPRYYIQGPGHSFFHRLTYAATRPLITRTDNGHSTLNAALLTGYAGSAALSYTYYPQINKNFHDTASTFGGSIGGAALGFVVSEFSDDVLKVFHKHKD